MADDEPDIAPDVEAVALKVLARTRVGGQRVLGTFTPAATEPGDRTTPTLEQVQAFIAAGVLRVKGRAATIADEHADLAKDVVAEYAAAQIELSLAPESSSEADSSYAQHMKAYTDGLDILTDATVDDVGDIPDQQGTQVLVSPTVAAYNAMLARAEQA